MSTPRPMDSLLWSLRVNLIQWQSGRTCNEAEHLSHILLLAFINNKVYALISVRLLHLWGRKEKTAI